jgi:aminobenzoyl-glutamate transport protein
VNKQFIVPRLGTYDPADGEGVAETEKGEITEAQGKGLRAAGIFSVLYILAFALMVIPSNGILRGEDGSILNGPFITGLVPVLILYFILVGVVYGITAGTIKKSSDVPDMMGQALEGMTGYIVLVFVIAQFINMFSYTNLGMIIAVKSAGALQAAGFTGIPLMLFFILLCCVVNLFMTSGSGKWYIFAPILVPMMMMLGYSPAFAQIIYRIGDSTTNAITPIYPYIPIAIGMAKKYDKNFGMGSLISMMLPYSVAFLIVWIIQLIVWVVLNLPLGPGVSVFM